MVRQRPAVGSQRLFRAALCSLKVAESLKVPGRFLVESGVAGVLLD
jgi:hypothetical protein